uniref:Uncharacterized protein n=1 Tax=Plectus sambesii TaxID=2011161 RepID=A0A914WM57_9BILA
MRLVCHVPRVLADATLGSKGQRCTAQSRCCLERISLAVSAVSGRILGFVFNPFLFLPGPVSVRQLGVGRLHVVPFNLTQGVNVPAIPVACSCAHELARR